MPDEQGSLSFSVRPLPANATAYNPSGLSTNVSGGGMATSGFRHIPCGAPVNASEGLAIEKVKSKLQGLQGPWVLLSNISHSSHAMRLSDEIDQVVIGPQGVFVVEVKHWDSTWLR
ncbi:MAG: nuclease-related domain-containing protein [Candidatus Accumulibacter meliphilus]|uniref:nuclease-related domain-containing protein n=1 Tax=Candidatus Accumulibacter meliphilus TaxID=2211374 RepID=UPI002FC29776